MTIGLSRNAVRLLTLLVNAHRRAEQDGLDEDQSWFTVSMLEGQTTIQFAFSEPQAQTTDRNAISVLQANGLIERFTTIDNDVRLLRYVVTQAGIATVERNASGH